MSKTDIRLMYQKETGLCLQTIDDSIENPHTEAYCSPCGNTTYHLMELDEDLIEYITWLESMLETALGDKGALITKITTVPKI